MDYYKSKSSYQEIDPVPQKGRKKLLYCVLIGASTLCLGSIMVLVFFNTVSSPAYSNVTHSNDSRDENLFRASAPFDSIPVDSVSVKFRPIDAVEVDSRPVDPITVDSVPVDYRQVDPSPIDYNSVDPVAIDSRSVDSAPVDSNLVNPVPNGSIVVDSVLVDPIPADSKLVHSVPIDSANNDSSPLVVVHPRIPDSGLIAIADFKVFPSSTSASVAVSPALHNLVPNVTVDPTDTYGSTAGNIATAWPPLEDILLELDLGSIRGKTMISRAGKEYLGFLGIPYAKPPLGELKFMSPVVPDAWNGTLDATQCKPDCIQKDKYNQKLVTKGSEDCLYINVYTPKTLADLKKRFDSNRFPVMVYIHGGGVYGSATRYGADYFMDENVVLVTFHYRLGILGNLNTNDSEARGNQGLKDQVKALQWVKNNIKKFGGSSRKVTIFGNSYGGMQVSAHLLSPMSNGLFVRAICQSGTIIRPEALTQNPFKSAIQLGKKLKCTGNTTKELVTCFRNTEPEQIILASYLMDFGTSIEPYDDSSEDVFLFDTPLKVLQDGQINRVTTMFGIVSGEGLSISLPILSVSNSTNAFNENWESSASEALALNHSTLLKDPERIANAAHDFYFGSNNLSREFETNFTAMFSDRFFAHPANVFATFQLEKNRRRIQNVYLYYFNKEADKSYADPFQEPYGSDEYLGAGHADELQFLFPYADYPVIPLGSKHANFSQMLVRLWVSFANTGKPTGADNGAEWLSIEKKKPYKWFEINDQPQLIKILGDRMNFWDTFNLTDLYV